MNWKFWPRTKIWQKVKASLRSSNSVLPTSSWLQANYRVSGICQSLPPQGSLNLFSRLPNTAVPNILCQNCIFWKSLFIFCYQPLPITEHPPWPHGCLEFRTTGLRVRGFQPQERCHSKFLSMEFGKQQYWALTPSTFRNYLPAKLTKGAPKALTALNTHISLVSHQSRGLFILEKLQKFKKDISIQASHSARLQHLPGNITAPVCSVYPRRCTGIRMGAHCRENLGTSET